MVLIRPSSKLILGLHLVSVLNFFESPNNLVTSLFLGLTLFFTFLTFFFIFIIFETFSMTSSIEISKPDEILNISPYFFLPSILKNALAVSLTYVKSLVVFMLPTSIYLF